MRTGQLCLEIYLEAVGGKVYFFCAEETIVLMGRWMDGWMDGWWIKK